MLGKPDSGKSTLLHVIQDILLRKENCSNLAWQDLAEKFAIVQVFGKLANIFADLPSEKIRGTGIFKAITGEDSYLARHPFGVAFYLLYLVYSALLGVLVCDGLSWTSQRTRYGHRDGFFPVPVRVFTDLF